MSRNNAVVVGETQNGKQIICRVPDDEALYEISFASGGMIPSELSGRWSDLRQIQNAVDVYLSKQIRAKSKDEAKGTVKSAKKRPSALKEKKEK